MDSTQIKFDFNTKAATGLMSIIYGKGVMPSVTGVFLIALFLFIIFFLLPYRMDLGASVLRFLMALGCAFIIYFFIKSLIEVVIGEDNIQLRTFKRYRKILLESIRLISVYYFTTSGWAFIRLKVNRKSFVYFLWAPNFEPERYQLFLKFVNSIREESKGRFTVKFRT